tara:strand:- start:7269 stop:8369 length:1101 start_codon:yes stop_codon:yes gene_type:complete
MLIFGAPFLSLSKYLDNSTFYKLSIIFPEIKDYIYHEYKQSIICKIEKKLDQILGDTDYRKLMIGEKLVMSGSFILQIILNTEWKYSDIDIFNIIDSSEEKSENFKLYLNNKSKRVSGDRVRYGGYNDKKNKIKEVFDYTINNGSTIQVIKQIIEKGHPLNFNDKIQYILKDFDIDVCKNVFYYDENSRPQLFINYACRIFQKEIKDIFIKDKQFQNIDDRLNKYKNRGFKFDNIDAFKKIIGSKDGNTKFGIIKKINAWVVKKYKGLTRLFLHFEIEEICFKIEPPGIYGDNIKIDGINLFATYSKIMRKRVYCNKCSLNSMINHIHTDSGPFRKDFIFIIPDKLKFDEKLSSIENDKILCKFEL